MTRGRPLALGAPQRRYYLDCSGILLSKTNNGSSEPTQSGFVYYFHGSQGSTLSGTQTNLFILPHKPALLTSSPRPAVARPQTLELMLTPSLSLSLALSTLHHPPVLSKCVLKPATSLASTRALPRPGPSLQWELPSSGPFLLVLRARRQPERSFQNTTLIMAPLRIGCPSCFASHL